MQFDFFRKQKKRRGPVQDAGSDGDFREDLKNLGRRGGHAAAIVVIAAVAAGCLMNSIYTLKEDQVAVVTTLGKPEAHTKAGLNFKIPFIQEVHRLSKNIMGMAIGYDPDYDTADHANSENNPAPVTSESEMITKDFNFVNVDFYVEYQITDPIQAYIYADSAHNIIKNLAQSYIRDTVGIYNVDDVITTGKAEIQAKVKEKLSQRLIAENIGYGIVNVSLQDAQPPTEEVSNAFKAVEDAKQSMDTAINGAKKYQSEQLPAANAQADKLIQEANAYKEQRIAEAEGQSQRYELMYQRYVQFPLITKKRMFYETMEDVLPGLKVVIDQGDGTQKILPLAPFESAGSAAGSTEAKGSSSQSTGSAANASNTGSTGNTAGNNAAAGAASGTGSGQNTKNNEQGSGETAKGAAQAGTTETSAAEKGDQS